MDWKLIGKHLGLTEAEITAVDGDNRTVEEKRVGMLEKWKGKLAYRATYHMLIESLLSVEQLLQVSSCTVLTISV